MKKFTRTYAIIHLDALHANIRQAKERVGDNVKIMAIVKADAYGHGAIEVAKAIKDEVYGFAVATAREAITRFGRNFRSAGTRLRISSN